MLVSVMLPCYNAAPTLPLALASMLAQTHSDWECVLVDDGSTDSTRSVVERFRDPRIKYRRFEQNAGRGAARRYALAAAKGDYLCLLDADDWMYPGRIEEQVEVLRSDSQLAVLSSGMAILDQSGDIVAVRARGRTGVEVHKPLRCPGPTPIAFPASMMRMSVARTCSFDPAMLLAQDTDFLMQTLTAHRWAVTRAVLYAYAEHSSVTATKASRSQRFLKKMFAKYTTEHPVMSRVRMVECDAKRLLYLAADSCGLWAEVLRRRSAPPESADVAAFHRARITVLSVLHSFN